MDFVIKTQNKSMGSWLGSPYFYFFAQSAKFYEIDKKLNKIDYFLLKI